MVDWNSWRKWDKLPFIWWVNSCCSSHTKHFFLLSPVLSSAAGLSLRGRWRLPNPGEFPHVVWRGGGNLSGSNPLQQQIGCSSGAAELSTGVWSPDICYHPTGVRTRVTISFTLLLPWYLPSSCISSYDCVETHFLDAKWTCSSPSSLLILYVSSISHWNH